MNKKSLKPAKLTKPTTGKSWRKSREEGELVPLSSGNTALLRPVSLDGLVRAGKIPNTLIQLVAEIMFSGGEIKFNDKEQAVELTTAWAELIELIVPLSMISPRVVDNPTADDEISLEDIDEPDKRTIVDLAMLGAGSMRNFRQFKERDVAGLSNGQNVQPAAVEST